MIDAAVTRMTNPRGTKAPGLIPGWTRAWNWGGWSVLDWVDMRRRTIGTVVAARSPHLEILGG